MTPKVVLQTQWQLCGSDKQYCSRLLRIPTCVLIKAHKSIHHCTLKWKGNHKDSTLRWKMDNECKHFKTSNSWDIWKPEKDVTDVLIDLNSTSQHASCPLSTVHSTHTAGSDLPLWLLFAPYVCVCTSFVHCLPPTCVADYLALPAYPLALLLFMTRTCDGAAFIFC